MLRKTVAAVSVGALALAYAAPTYAFDCAVAKKPARAGAALEINVVTGQETVLKSNPGTEDHIHGGFIALTDGENSISTFAHAPDGVLPPVREGGSQQNCDGKGLESIEACFGG